MLRNLVKMDVAVLYETLFKSEINDYGKFLVKYRKKYKGKTPNEAFELYSESSSLEKSQHWFAYHILLMSELDCVWAGEQRHREEAHTQNLLTALKKMLKY